MHAEGQTGDSVACAWATVSELSGQSQAGSVAQGAGPSRGICPGGDWHISPLPDTVPRGVRSWGSSFL